MSEATRHGTTTDDRGDPRSLTDSCQKAIVPASPMKASERRLLPCHFWCRPHRRRNASFGWMMTTLSKLLAPRRSFASTSRAERAAEARHGAAHLLDLSLGLHGGLRAASKCTLPVARALVAYAHAWTAQALPECGHVFHGACVLAWFRSSVGARPARNAAASCPCCRVRCVEPAGVSPVLSLLELTHRPRFPRARCCGCAWTSQRLAT